ncbi:MAG: flagellar basal body P-ring formation chaperone FlgA [Bacillota bacterium]
MNRSVSIYKQLVISVICSLIIFYLFTAGAYAQPKVSVDYQVETNHDKIKLGEIADIEAETQFKKRLAAVNLGQAPLPGYSRVLKRRHILSALQRAGFKLAELSYQIPKQVKITTPYQTLDQQKLEQTVSDYIRSNLTAEQEDIEINIRNSDNDKLKLPVGNINLEVPSSYNRSLLGRTSIPVNIYVDNELARKKYVSVEVVAYQEVLVARKRLDRHTKLTADLFKQERRALNNVVHRQPIQDINEVENHRLKRRINQGQILTSRMVEIPPLVKRRDKVTIIARVGQIEVRTVGLALETGAKGDIIQVENIKSGEKLTARVIKQGTVQVIL